MMEVDACEEFLMAWRTDDVRTGFGVKIRVECHWDEEQFETIVRVFQAFLAQLRKGHLPSKRVVDLLLKGFPSTVSDIRHPNFRDISKPVGLQAQEWEEFIDARVGKLQEMYAAFVFAVEARLGQFVVWEAIEDALDKMRSDDRDLVDV